MYLIFRALNITYAELSIFVHAQFGACPNILLKLKVIMQNKYCTLK
jgi:hypothetical protein